MSNNDTPRGLEIDLFRIFRLLLSKWWLIVLFVAVFATSSFVLTKVSSEPTYTSDITFTVYSKSVDSVDGNFSSSDINSSILMTNTFKYIITSREMLEKVAQSVDFQISVKALKECITVRSISNTNILSVDVTTESADKSFSIARGIADNYSEILDYAYPNASMSVCENPVRATAKDSDASGLLAILIGAFVGGVISFIIIVVSDTARDTVRSIDDIHNKLELTHLGTITQIKEKSRKDKQGNPIKNLLITDRKLGFSFIEVYKTIRTKIEAASVRNGFKTFTVSSTSENEGKTTVAVNIALSLAQNNRSVLLIDADLRKPAVNKFLEMNVGKDVGLSSVIKGKMELSEAIKYIEKYKLFVLTAGSGEDEPTEILSSPQMEQIIEAAQREFDFIIIDTAPAGVVADAAIIANYTDATVFVIREDFTSCANIRQAIEDMSEGKSELIGCVFNNVAVTYPGNYNKYHYGMNRGYGRYGHYGRYGYGYSSASDSGNDKNADSDA